MSDRYQGFVEAAAGEDGLRNLLPRKSGYRSAGEEQIARYLDRNRIPFIYEHPLAVVDRGKTRLWYPDFQLPTLGLVLEFGGKLEDPQYAAAWLHKKSVYSKNKLQAVLLTREDLKGFWPPDLTRRIQEILEDRVKQFKDLTKNS